MRWMDVGAVQDRSRLGGSCSEDVALSVGGVSVGARRVGEWALDESEELRAQE